MRHTDAAACTTRVAELFLLFVTMSITVTCHSQNCRCSNWRFPLDSAGFRAARRHNSTNSSHIDKHFCCHASPSTSESVCMIVSAFTSMRRATLVSNQLTINCTKMHENENIYFKIRCSVVPFHATCTLRSTFSIILLHLNRSVETSRV